MRGLPLDDAPKPRRHCLLVFSVLFALSVAGVFFLSPHSVAFTRTAARDFQWLPISCPTQHSALAPAIQFTPSHKENVYVKRLQGAIQIRTETFDGAAQDGSDPWYDKFYEFEAYLLETFPDVFANLKLEHFATHGLLLTWQGSDESLAPIILMAHQDTVPVPDETVERWTHPPFAGHVDHEGWVWGRGVGDCKNTLIAELSAVSELFNAGFSPKRTVLLAFGFDEEGGAVHSARAIANHLEAKYGRDSIFMIVDEGGGVMEDYFGQTWVAPATVRREGQREHQGIGQRPWGAFEHSVRPFLSSSIYLSFADVISLPSNPAQISISLRHTTHPIRPTTQPTPHTGIGILSTLVAAIEAHPPPVALSAGNPFSEFAMCLREYDSVALYSSVEGVLTTRTGTIDGELKRALGHERTWDVAARLMAERSPGDKACVFPSSLLLVGGIDIFLGMGDSRLSTTQAVDIVRGGVKVNALPEEAHAIVNHRVSVDDSIESIQERYLALLKPEAAKFNLSVVDFGEDPPADAERYVRLEIPGGVGAEASPVTPARGDAWRVFSGTSLHLWPDAIVAPYLSTGGTDTRSYVRLTRAIYRFRGMRDSHRENTHTVDERVHVRGHMDAIEWVHAVIQNADADEWRGE
ncbi:Gly-Xaa carboxypeptidase [Mycena venus]|uniref:Gly-Xaa carboxypeptidase n=1 Tax=Mycena venus TaxID=2733690 RepID=A0A8H7CV12_9AGAR|nr:Gly-Xaa carboxypeptidase [Mycena venus]